MKVEVAVVWFSVALRPQRRVGLLGTGTEWEGGERVKGSTAETARKRPERPWTAARTMEVLRRCPLAIAQRLVHCAIAVPTAVLDRVTKTMSVAPLLMNNLDNSKQKRPTCSAQLHLPTHDLFWAKLRVQLHLPPLRSLDLLISPGTLGGRPGLPSLISLMVSVDVKQHPTNHGQTELRNCVKVEVDVLGSRP